MTTKGAKVRKVILWVLAVVGVIAIIAVILGAGFLRSTMSSMAEDYDAYTVERGEMTVSIQGTGAMQSADVRDVISARGGRVQNLSVEAGQRVEAGDILYEVYDESLENLITQEQNSIESNRISRSKLSAGYKNYKVYAPVDGVISALYARKGEEGATTAKVHGSLCVIGEGEGATPVTGAGRVSKIYVSEGETVSRGDLLFAMDSTDVSKSIEAIDLAIKVSEDNIEKARAKMEDNRMTAPVSGVVSAVAVKEGQQITAGMAVAQVVDTSSQEVVIEVDELDIPKVALGQRAVVRVDALEDVEFEGSVSKISELGKSVGGITTYDVTIGVAAPEGVKIGMSTSAEIVIEQREGVLIVPVDCVVREDGVRKVRVLAPGADLSQPSTWAKDSAGNSVPYVWREVEMGASNELRAEILSGLEEGDTVLVEKENAMIALMRRMQEQQQRMMGGNN